MYIKPLEMSGMEHHLKNLSVEDRIKSFGQWIFIRDQPNLANGGFYWIGTSEVAIRRCLFFKFSMDGRSVTTHRTSISPNRYFIHALGDMPPKYLKKDNKIVKETLRLV